MLYILAVCAPPLACLGAGKFLRSVVAFVLCATIVGTPVAMLLAWRTVKNAETR